MAHRLACLYYLMGLVSTVNALTWTRGDAASLAVNVGPDAISYAVRMSGQPRPWLESETPGSLPRIFCGGAWQTMTLGDYTELNSTDLKLGPFDALRIEWAVAQPAPGTMDSACASKRIETTFTYYRDHDALAFSHTFVDEIADTMTPPQPRCPKCQFNSTSVPRSEFPSFSAAKSTELHNNIGWWQWGGKMTNARQGGGVGLRSPGNLKEYPDNDGLVGGQEGGPLVLFEEGESRGDALVFSPMGAWFASVLGMRPLLNSSSSLNENALVAGVQGDVTNIPAGHTASFLLCATRGKGINSGVQRWGAVLRAKFAVPKLASTVVEQKLGYWTDNGGFYYGPEQLTTERAQTLFADLGTQQVPIGYVQLDPWAWKGYVASAETKLPGGRVFWRGAGKLISWTAEPSFFPKDGFMGLSKAGTAATPNKTHMPLLLYSLWWEANETAAFYKAKYNEDYEFVTGGWHRASGERVIAQPSPESSRAFYNRVIGDHKDVIGGFEIDFLWFTALIFEEFRQSVDSLFRWVQGMNDAAFSHGISIQYCMDLPSYALASMEFGAVTNARASDDNFPWGEDGAPRHYRWKIAYGALLYNAIGLQPFMDVIWTQAEQPHNIANQGRFAKRTNIDLQATVAALASGPVGIGDGPGFTNKTVAMKFCTAAGTLLHPTAAATPVDKMFHRSLRPEGATAEVWSAPSEIPARHGESAGPSGSESGPPWVWWTVLAVDIGKPFPLERSDLVRPPTLSAETAAANRELIAWQLGDSACADGKDARQCVSTLSSTTPLLIKTGLPTQGCEGHSTDPTGCLPEHKHSTWSIGPVCSFKDESSSVSSANIEHAKPDAVALLGEMHKYVAVSPDRLSFTSCQASEYGDGANSPGWLRTQMQVGLRGAAGERVELLFMRRCAGLGQLTVVNVTIEGQGEARVVCDACGARSSLGCTQQ